MLLWVLVPCKFPWENALPHPPYKNQSLITYTRESPRLLASSQNDLGLLLHWESNSKQRLSSNKGPFELRSFVLGLLLCHCLIDWHFVAMSPLCIRSSLDFLVDNLLLFFLWVVSTCVLVCLALLLDGFPVLNLFNFFNKVFLFYLNFEPTPAPLLFHPSWVRSLRREASNIFHLKFLVACIKIVIEHY